MAGRRKTFVVFIKIYLLGRLAPGTVLEVDSQTQLHNSWFSSARHPPKRVALVAAEGCVNGSPLRVIERVVEFRAEIHLYSFERLEALGQGNVPVVRAGTPHDPDSGVAFHILGWREKGPAVEVP